MYPIDGYEGRYMMTEGGGVYSLLTNKILKTSLDKDGYKRLSLRGVCGKRKTFTLHRLIAKIFIPNPENKPCVNHIDGVKSNNRVDNLEWCTVSENTKHSYDMGLQPKPYGESNNNNKLREKDVLEIRRLWEEGVMQKVIAKKFDIKQPTVSNIVRRKIWPNLRQACAI